MKSPRHDLAVVVITVGRSSLLRAVRSIYRQRHSGPIQILIGVDADLTGRIPELRAILETERPASVSLFWLDPGYSTSRRNSGVHDCRFGGSLRSILTLLADARLVMYLDDDDWLLEDHTPSILTAIEGKKWAFAYSWYCDGNSSEPICVDEIESVGVDQGCYAESLGGFVRPSGLTIDKLALLKIVHLWSTSAFAEGDGEDRIVFSRLRGEPHACTGSATVCYTMDPKDDAHHLRLALMQSKGITCALPAKDGSVR